MSATDRKTSASWPPHEAVGMGRPRGTAVKKMSKAQFVKMNKERRISMAQKSDEAEALRVDREFAQDFAKAALRGAKNQDEEV